jgi:type VI secretion system (T6SS) effector TldE1-like protein
MSEVWRYSQKTGELCAPNGSCVATGYAGAGVCENQPAMQWASDRGPIPRGLYTIGPPRDDDQMGPFCLPLEPDPNNEMHDRFGFYMHGDNDTGTASTGCIIMPRTTREQVAASSCDQLEVTT